MCSSKLDVQETNCRFAQFNRIWNHLVGNWTEIGWFACSGTMGFNCFCSWKYYSYFRTGKPVNGEKSHNKINVMQDIDSVPSNVQSASQEASLYVFEDNDAVIKMIMKGRIQRWDTCPDRTELLLIGCSIESIWFSKTKSNNIDTKNNSKTFWPKETSHVMSGIIFRFCWSLVISVPQIVLKWCQKKKKTKRFRWIMSQQSRNRWWIWTCDAAKGLLMC